LGFAGAGWAVEEERTHMFRYTVTYECGT
jgi:hypothetical protein